jgi:hypothetical protein
MFLWFLLLINELLKVCHPRCVKLINTAYNVFILSYRCSQNTNNLSVSQPDDGPLTRPKHVVVYYIVILSDILFVVF